MMKTPMLAVLLLAAPAFAASDFSTDASAILVQAKASAKKDAAVVNSVIDGGVTYQPACTTFKFGPNDGTVSKSVPLSSQGMKDQCIPTGPNGQPSCFPQPYGPTYNLNVQITVEGRPALNAGEHDDFEVCLAGSWLSTKPAHTTYEYTVVADGSETGNIVVKAGKKK